MNELIKTQYGGRTVGCATSTGGPGVWAIVEVAPRHGAPTPLKIFLKYDLPLYLLFSFETRKIDSL